MKQFYSALTSIRRSPYQSLAAILILSITLFVAYTFSMVMLGAEVILRYFETRPQVIAFFDVDAPNSQIELAQKTMAAKPYVDQTSVISKDKALELYKETNKQEPLLLELVSAEILPASLEVSGKNVESLAQIRTDLESLAGVNEVVFQENVIDNLRSVTKSLRLIGLGAASILGVTSFLTIMVLTSMKIRMKRGAVNIMRMIGATRMYIKAPFIYEAAVYGITSSILGWGAMYIALLYLTPWLNTFVGTINILPVPWIILVGQVAVGTLVAVLLTTWAALTAVSRIIKS